MAVAKEAKKKKAGEAVPQATAEPINEAKALQLILMMFPQAREKSPTLKDGITWMLAEMDRQRRQIVELEKAVPGPNIKDGGSQSEILAGIKRLEDSLKQLKEQFSVMRQHSMTTK